MKRESCASDKLKIERELLSQGFETIAGVDEVGRGPLAGPVVCAAVIMPLKEIEIIQGVDDSKKLSPKKGRFWQNSFRNELWRIPCTK